MIKRTKHVNASDFEIIIASETKIPNTEQQNTTFFLPFLSE
jgi:hypothetical protein